MAQTDMQPQQRFPELDGIRGLAILGVLCSHGASLSGIFAGAHSQLATWEARTSPGGIGFFQYKSYQ
jgi:peptidoglycan/LPS O-acetylase OafA/YrhL